jgi:hypothetical protein
LAFVAQSVQKARIPCAGLVIANICALVIRGGKNPFVVDFKSRMAEALLVPPFGLISIDWAEATKEVKIESKIKILFMFRFFFS